MGYYSDLISDIIVVPNGYILFGYSSSTNRDFSGMPGTGDYDAFVYSTNKNGTKWAVLPLGGSNADKIQAGCVLKDGSLAFCGSTASSDGNFEGVTGSTSSAASFVSKATIKLSQ